MDLSVWFQAPRRWSTRPASGTSRALRVACARVPSAPRASSLVSRKSTVPPATRRSLLLDVSSVTRYVPSRLPQTAVAKYIVICVYRSTIDSNKSRIHFTSGRSTAAPPLV